MAAAALTSNRPACVQGCHVIGPEVACGGVCLGDAAGDDVAAADDVATDDDVASDVAGAPGSQLAECSAFACDASTHMKPPCVASAGKDRDDTLWTSEGTRA